MRHGGTRPSGHASPSLGPPHGLRLRRAEAPSPSPSRFPGKRRAPPEQGRATTAVSRGKCSVPGAARLDHTHTAAYGPRGRLRDTGKQGHRNAVTPGHRDPGTLGHRDTGTPGRRDRPRRICALLSFGITAGRWRALPAAAFPADANCSYHVKLRQNYLSR